MQVIITSIFIILISGSRLLNLPIYQDERLALLNNYVIILLAFFLLISKLSCSCCSSCKDSHAHSHDIGEHAKPEPVKQVSTSTQEINASIVQLLSLLQSKGRFIDFIMGDITAHNNEAVGAASRVVHQGCASVIKEYCKIVPISEAKEGETIKVENSLYYKLVGGDSTQNVETGKLLHHGWKAIEIKLPRIQDYSKKEAQEIITPAEVEGIKTSG